MTKSPGETAGATARQRTSTGDGCPGAAARLLMAGETLEDSDPEGAHERRSGGDGLLRGVHHHLVQDGRVGLGCGGGHAVILTVRGANLAPRMDVLSGRKVIISYQFIEYLSMYLGW